MLARVAGQGGKWQDPHNGGTYTLLVNSEDEVLFQRQSSSWADQEYTDKLLFKFTPGASNATCAFTGCSESQDSSMEDWSANYCNLRNLYCGRADGCCPVSSDFEWQQTATQKSSGAGEDADVCLGGKSIRGGGSGVAMYQTQTSCPGEDEADGADASDGGADGAGDSDSNSGNASGEAGGADDADRGGDGADPSDGGADGRLP